LFGNFTEEARNIIVVAKEEMTKLKHPYVGSEHLLLAILKTNNEVGERLKKHHISYDKVLNEIKKIIGVGNKESNWFLYTPILRRIIENSIIDSKEQNQDVTINHLFLNFLEEGEGIGIRILLSLNVDIDKLYLEHKTLKNKKKKQKLKIEELGTVLTDNKYFDPIIGREKEIKRIIEILSRKTKNNPILVGDAGVGKTAIVEMLAKRIKENKVPKKLMNKKIISLDMASLVAGTKYRGEFEEKIKKVLQEVEECDDVILFIDEIHTLVGAGGAEGAIDASNIFKPALARNKLCLIGATTLHEYKKFFEEDKALDRRFQKVFVDEPTISETNIILKNLIPVYENYHQVKITDDVIKNITSITCKYIKDRKRPDSLIDILDEACSKVSLKQTTSEKEIYNLNEEYHKIKKQKEELLQKREFKKAKELLEKEKLIEHKINNFNLKKNKNNYKKHVTLKDIAYVIKERTNIPVYEILGENKKTINLIENKINSKIIGQAEAKKKMMKTIKKIKLGFNEEDKCMSYMFVGPSGVGKTMLATEIANLLVGPKNVIRLDMSEYKEAHSVSKIIGSPPGYVGYKDNNNILEEIKNKPYNVIILDEIEKAHSSIINLFYQILENSKIRDSKGDFVYFNNSIIIMTSNVGSLNNFLGFTPNSNNINRNLKDEFQIPFVNRINDVIKFKHFNENEIKKIIEQNLNTIKLNYKKKNININFTKNLVNELVLESDFKEMGARKVCKIINDKLYNIIIDEILNDNNKILINTLKDYTYV
jgi:ATP-dependent Clp protease ATP-binding subunit ClpC